MVCTSTSAYLAIYLHNRKGNIKEQIDINYKIEFVIILQDCQLIIEKSSKSLFYDQKLEHMKISVPLYSRTEVILT